MQTIIPNWVRRRPIPNCISLIEFSFNEILCVRFCWVNARSLNITRWRSEAHTSDFVECWSQTVWSICPFEMRWLLSVTYQNAVPFTTVPNTGYIGMLCFRFGGCSMLYSYFSVLLLMLMLILLLLLLLAWHWLTHWCCCSIHIFTM